MPATEVSAAINAEEAAGGSEEDFSAVIRRMEEIAKTENGDEAENNTSEPNSPEKRSPGCPECDRVWRVYALATRQALDAILAKEASTQREDIGKMKVLEDKVLEAAQWQAIARKAV